MKTHSLLISMLVFLCVMGACNSGPVLRNATGFAYEIVVTMDKTAWDAPGGQAIKAELASDIRVCRRPNRHLKLRMRCLFILTDC